VETRVAATSQRATAVEFTFVCRFDPKRFAIHEFAHPHEIRCTLTSQRAL
jgi:hypothetical protein